MKKKFFLGLTACLTLLLNSSGVVQAADSGPNKTTVQKGRAVQSSQQVINSPVITPANKLLPKGNSTSQQPASKVGSQSAGAVSKPAATAPSGKSALDGHSRLGDDDETFDYYGLPCSYDSATQTITVSGGTMTNSASFANQLVVVANRVNVLKIVITGPVKVVGNMDEMFALANNLTEIDGLDKINTSQATNMSGLFQRDTALTNLDLPTNWDTSNVTNMSYMFEYDSALTTLDVSHLDTSKVTDMSNMFDNNTALTTLDVSHFNTSKVTNMSYMFSYCPSLTALDVSNFNTSKVTNMERMLVTDPSLERLNLSEKFAINSSTQTASMFSNTLPKVLILGSKVQLKSDMALPDISSAAYTGKWQNVGTGTEAAPAGINVWSSADLMSNYKGTTGQPDTYVWQPAQTPGKITLKFVDSAGNQLRDPVTIDPSDKQIGDTYDYKDTHTQYDTDIIKDYDYDSASSNAQGAYTADPTTITYTYKGVARITSPATFDFGSHSVETNQTYDSAILNNQSLSLVDTLPNSSGWTLAGQLTSPLKGITDQAAFPGSMYYSNDGSATQNMSSQTVIATGTDKEKNISDGWTNGKGLKLKTTNYPHSEVYQGTITWTLTDGVSNK